jgi:FSR family fosmidomycin resistance protein-like MFS transporter
MPFGLLADKWNKNALFAVTGCGLAALSFCLGKLDISAAVAALGIGNALFHIGGGIEILNLSRGKAYLLGIFVSPGALGIYLGTVLGRRNDLPSWVLVLMLITVAVSILGGGYRNKSAFRSDNAPVSFSGISGMGTLAAIGSLFAVVLLRSYIGMASDFSWKVQLPWGIMLISAVVSGKMCGGFLADKVGAFKACAISLGPAGILYFFSNNPIAGTAAVFFFNMTMPITLWALARIMDGSKGLAFGILTFGLFLGFVPEYFAIAPQIPISLAFPVISLISLLFLRIGLRKEVIK